MFVIKQVAFSLPKCAIHRLTPHVNIGLLHSTCRRQLPRFGNGPSLKDFIAADTVAEDARISDADKYDGAPYLREEDVAGQGRKGKCLVPRRVQTPGNEI